MFEHDRHRAILVFGGRLHPDRHPEIGGDRDPDGHLDAAHGPSYDDPLARQLDHTDAFVRGLVADRELHWKGKGVEPLVTARPGRCNPAERCLTPQDTLPAGFPGHLPRRKFVPRSLPQTCLKCFGIRLMFSVNPRYHKD